MHSCLLICRFALSICNLLIQPERCTIIHYTSQEILNRPVFVLEILKKSEQSEHSEYCLKILNKSWTFWILSEKSEHSEHFLNRVWTFWTESEHSEHCLKSLNIVLKVWTFWTLSEKSEQSLNILNMVWTKSEHS